MNSSRSVVETIHGSEQRDGPLRSSQIPRDRGAIQSILVCLDHSAYSDACLRSAVAISKSLGSAVTLLHVMQPSAHPTNVVDWALAKQQARAWLEGLQGREARASGRPVAIRIEEGYPAERIVGVARELRADLTILGGRGEHQGADWNLGGTAQQVLSVTRSSVFITRETANETSPKRILVPLDGSLRTESVLPTAMRIAKRHGAGLLLALVVHEPAPSAVLSAPEDLKLAHLLATRLESSGKRYLDALHGQLERDGVSAHAVVLRCLDERQCLLDLSRDEKTDLIILSAHGASCNPALAFGSVTTHFLNHSRLPVLVLQDLRDRDLAEEEKERGAPPLRATFAPDDV